MVAYLLDDAARFNTWLTTFCVSRLIIQIGRAPVSAKDPTQSAHMLAAKYCPVKMQWLLRDNIGSWYHTLTFATDENGVRTCKPANHGFFNTFSRVFRLDVYWLE